MPPAAEARAASKQLRMQTNYVELKKCIENANYLKVVKTCNKIISDDDTELKAWQCKVTALIQLSSFDETIAQIDKSKMAESFAFEKAYCLYRQNKVSAALEILNKVTLTSAREKELKAQILYRLERYDECYSAYRELIRNTSDDFDQERLSNLSAVIANKAREGKCEEGPVAGNDATYEQVYNYGCELVSRGQLQKALQVLQRAENTCRKFLQQEEGATEEEITEEVSVISVQKGYCLQLMGKEKEALGVYNDVVKKKPKDSSLLAIINLNLVTLNKEGNFFDSKKRMKTIVGTELQHKLTSKQRAVICLNQCLLAYQTGQENASEASRLLKEYPQFSFEANVLMLMQLAKTRDKAGDVIEVLKSYREQTPDMALRVSLAVVQVLLAEKNVSLALSVLSTLPSSDSSRSGIVSALVVLHNSLHESNQAALVLRDAVQWHRDNKTSSCELQQLWRRAASFHLRSGDAQTAVESLQELRKVDTSDVVTLAQLIAAYATFDIKAAQSLAKELPPIQSLVKKVDVKSLEAAVGVRTAKRLQGKAGTNSPTSPTSPANKKNVEVVKPSRKKRNRKCRLPKNYNPNVVPDPERWLPKWQRKGKRKRERRTRDNRDKEGGIGKGTQGGAMEAADKYDITKQSKESRDPQKYNAPRVESLAATKIKRKRGNKKR